MSSLFDLSGFTFPTRETAGQYELGTPFKVTFAGEITHLRWKRQTTSGDAPSAIRVWRASDETVVATAASITDGGTVGWKDCPITGGWRPDLNVEYRVAVSNPASSGLGAQSLNPVPAVPNGLNLPQSGRAYHVATPYVYPSTIEPSAWEAVDVVYVPDSPPPPPATTGDVDQALLDWLSSSSSVNLHQSDGLPWLTKTVVDAIRSATGNTAGQLDATKAVSDAIHDLLTSTDHNLGTLWDLAGHLADLEIAAWQAFFGAGAQRLTGPDSAGGSAFYTADGELISQLVAETWQRVRVLRGDIGFGTDGWTMSAEADFEDAIAFAEPADAYTLHITSYQPTQAASTSPAGLWLPRIGWWCILTGAHASQRQFVDFEQQLLSDQGHRMPGCAIQLKPGTLATVQAWLLA